MAPKCIPTTRKRYKFIMVAVALSKSSRSARLAAAWVQHQPSFLHPATRVRRHAATCRDATLDRNKLILPSHDKPIHSVMAPMVAASDYAFRCLVERHGVDLCFTQMLHARSLVENAVFQRNHLDFPFRAHLSSSQLDCIDGMSQYTVQPSHLHSPGPLIVQLAGHHPELMLNAFDVLIENECEFAGVDVNLGCPQAIARKGKYGAFLHEHDEDLTCDILRKLRKHVPPEYSVSCKIRLPRSLKQEHVQSRISRLVETGVNFITLHGRTLEENKTKTGAVHSEMIRLAVEMAGNIPVIANGGVERHSDVKKLLDTTSAAAIMSSEALLETPNLFSTDSFLLPSQEMFQQQISLAREYISLCATYPPLPGVLGGCGSFSIAKGHLFKILHRYLHQHTDIRDQLMHSSRLTDAVRVLEALESRYQNAEDYEQCPSSRVGASWYRRHWAANKRVHQRKRQTLNVSTKSVEERKEEMKLRIAKLREQRLAKNIEQERIAV